MKLGQLMTSASIMDGNSSDILGNIFWFSIGDMLMHEEDVKTKLQDAGISLDYMPNPIRVSDAFRRATTEVRRKRDTEYKDLKERLLIVEIASSPEMIIRQVVIESIDRVNKDLSYQVGNGEIELNKNKELFKYSSKDPEIRKVCEEVEEKFNLYREHYSPQAIRGMITNIIGDLSVIPMRRNGIIYFVPNKKSDDLMKLIKFLNSLEGSEAFTIAVKSEESANEMVHLKLDENLDDLLKQCQESDDLTKGQIKALIEETNLAIDGFNEYKEITNEKTDYFLEKVAHLKDEVLRVTTRLG